MKQFSLLNRLIEKSNNHKGLIHTLAMLFSFFITLCTIYTESQPYRYVTSSHAIIEGLLVNDLVAVTKWEDVYDWTDNVIDSLSRWTSDIIKLNCLSEVSSQEVYIDSWLYNLDDPNIDYTSCYEKTEYVEYISENRPVYSGGNNQVLLFGLFTERVATSKPYKGSTGVEEDVSIFLEEPLDGWEPLRDKKIAEICQAPWGELCVRSDAYADSPASTFGWTGRTIDDRQAFTNESVAFLYNEGFQYVTPCYTYTTSVSDNEEGDILYVVTPGVGSDVYNGTVEDVDSGLYDCSNHWLASGHDVRSECFVMRSRARVARMSFVVAYYGQENIVDFLNHYFTCDMLTSTLTTVHDLDLFFYETNYTFRAHLSDQNLHGNFIPVNNEYDLAGDGTGIGLLSRTLTMIDDYTRSVVFYIVLRNVGESELFYTMIKMRVTITTNGKARTEISTVYVPIVQYYYGLNGSPWLIKDAAIFESIFLLMMVTMLLRESYELVVKRGPYIVKRLLSPTNAYILPTTTNTTNTTTITASTTATSGTSGSGNSSEHHQLEQMKQIKEVKEMDIPPETGNNVKEFHETEHAGSDTGTVTGGGEGADVVLNEHDHKKTVMTEESSSLVPVLLPDEVASYDILDWATLIVYFIAIIYRIIFIEKAQSLHLYIISINGDYDSNLESLITKFSLMDELSTAHKVATLAGVVLSLFQFFRYMSFDPRFGVVAASIWSSMKDLLPVASIFIAVLVAYGVLGSAIYGQHLGAWSNLGNSIASLFFLILGEFGGYPDMARVSPLETVFFFWTFVVLVLFILFNMVLAIIFTVYEERRADITSSKQQQ